MLLVFWIFTILIGRRLYLLVGWFFFLSSNFESYLFSVGGKHGIQTPGVTEIREGGAGCDVGGGTVGSLSTPGLPEYFLKHSREPRELKGRSIPSYGKTGKNYEYFITYSFPQLSEAMCDLIECVKRDVHISLELAYSEHTLAFHSFTIATPMDLCSQGSQTVSSVTLEVDFISRHLN